MIERFDNSSSGAYAFRKTDPGAQHDGRFLRWHEVKRRSAVGGFTLVELMVTLTVAVILVIVAVPSFKGIIFANKLTTTSNNVVNAIALARLEAIKRNTTSQLCSNSSSLNTTGNTSATLGSLCTTQTGAVFVLTGTTATKVGDAIVGLVSPVQLSGNLTALTFSSSGLAYQVGSTSLYNGTVSDICTSSISSNNHRKVTMAAGSILTTLSSSATCP